VKFQLIEQGLCFLFRETFEERFRFRKVGIETDPLGINTSQEFLRRGEAVG